MTNKHTKHLLAGVTRGYELVESRDPAEAMNVYRKVLAQAQNAGIVSAHLYWAYAVACDYAGELEMAFENVTAAITRDPLAMPFRNSFEVIVRRIREALCKPDRVTDDPSTPRLYALLVGSGEADVDSHVAMARYHLATGNVEASSAIADAAALFYPTERAVWDVKAAIADARGDAAAAEQARIEAAAAEAAATPFAIPGTARA